MSELKYVDGRIVCMVDLEQKNHWTFSDGTTIRLERQFDNFDRKHTEQVLGVVVDAENIPKDALVLFHHNSLHETYEIKNHSQLSGKEIASGIKYFSIMERDCFFWKGKNDADWKTTTNYETALRVFKPYIGFIQGIEHRLIPDTLFVTSGNYKGKVVRTLKASDYQLTFRDHTTGRDVSMIRFRPDGDKEREAEAIAVMDGLTKELNEGKLLIGLTISDCKKIFDYYECEVNIHQ